MEPFDLLWVEIDTRSPSALRYIRERSDDPRGLRRVPLRPARVPAVLRAATRWTWRSSTCPGTASPESVKIAAMADAYEVNVAPHNFYSHLATMMSAHFAAVVPNLRIMEIDPETVPWQDDLVTRTPRGRGRAPAAADGPRLGHRGRRGGRPGAPASRPARSRTGSAHRPPLSTARRPGADSRVGLASGASRAAKNAITRATTAGSRRMRRCPSPRVVRSSAPGQAAAIDAPSAQRTSVSSRSCTTSAAIGRSAAKREQIERLRRRPDPRLQPAVQARRAAARARSPP